MSSAVLAGNQTGLLIYNIIISYILKYIRLLIYNIKIIIRHCNDKSQTSPHEQSVYDLSDNKPCNLLYNKFVSGFATSKQVCNLSAGGNTAAQYFDTLRCGLWHYHQLSC